MQSDTEQTTYTTTTIERILLEGLELGEFSAEDIDEVRDLRSFLDAGIMTSNRGLVLTMMDGTEFQLSIVQSK